jgi:hypothetical protein
LNSIYYTLKPGIPRNVQIFLRRLRARHLLRKYAHVWPINEKAGKPPKGWKGWSEGKKFALVLTHDVDTAGGQKKCRDLMNLEMKLGFRSSFNFVPRRYDVSRELREELVRKGFEVGVHGLYHDGKYYHSREIFRERARQINEYIKEWECTGFRSPSMQHNLDWIHDLEIEYDASTFDTDPFEPQSDGMCTIFPFWVKGSGKRGGYVELPYTLPQDFTLFVLMKQTDIGIWKRKLDWIAENNGMALINAHPDYMEFERKRGGSETYPAKFYSEFLKFVKSRHEDEFWNCLPRDMARFWEKDSSKGSEFVKDP